MLIREFVAWCRERYRDRPWRVDAYFGRDRLDEELESLATALAPPGVPLLLALVDGEPAGCLGLRTLRRGVCEMKRFFVRGAHQGRGLGRALADTVVALARERGFETMRLQRGDRQIEAQALYRSLGFWTTVPYGEAPPELRPFIVSMELDLAARSRAAA